MITNLDPKVTVFILNWNRKVETCRAIESALNQTYTNFEIIVVDNGSSDGSKEYITSRHPKITFIQLDKNYGCPGGRNRGIQYCNGDFIFYLDNDGALHQKAVENAVKCIFLDEKIAVVTGLVKDFNNESEIDTCFKLPSISFYETNLFQGGISMHRKSIYEQIGFYPDDYIYGGEETYLSYRIMDKGYKIVKSEQIVLWHKKSELARNHGKELIRGWGNALMNAFQLFPTKYFIIFFIYFFSVYPFYSLKHGFLNLYIKSLPDYLKRLKKYKRNPVSQKTYNIYRSL